MALPLSIRRAEDRGHFDHGWLDTYHTFSFAAYHDEKQMGFRSLRVLNEDRVKPGRGFGTHGHRDMEIVSYVLAGALALEDSMGNGSVIVPGDVQYMSAGTGVQHSEFNHSEKELVHFVQIWILPDRRGYAPRYGQKRFEPAEKEGRLRLVASGSGADGSIELRQDVNLYASLLPERASTSFSLSKERHIWVQALRGELSVNGETLRPGDGLSAPGGADYVFSGTKGTAELLVFDLA